MMMVMAVIAVVVVVVVGHWFRADVCYALSLTLRVLLIFHMKRGRKLANPCEARLPSSLGNIG